MPRIIAIAGKERAGKDTLASILVNRFGYTRMAFADPLKDMVYTLLNFREENKDEIDPVWGITPRQALIFFGTDIMQEKIEDLLPGVGRSFWVRHMIARMPRGASCIVISDLRYPHEEQALKDMGAYFVCIERDGIAYDGPLDTSSYHHVLNHGPMEHLVTEAGRIDAAAKKNE